MKTKWCFPKKGDKIKGLSEVCKDREYEVDYVKSALNGDTRIFTTLGTYFKPWECELIT